MRHDQVTERRDIKVDAVYDIETQNWTRFVAGGIAWPDGSYKVFDWRNENDLVDSLLAIRTDEGKRARVWAHNGGKFDHKWLCDHLLKRGEKVTLVAGGSRIIRATVKGVEFLDSAALTKMRLVDLTKGLTDEKQKTNLPCVCDVGCTGRDCKARGESCPLCKGEGCGGYCSITRDMPHDLWQRLLRYLESDCRSLLAGLERLREFAKEHDIDLAATVGGAAWSHAKRMLDLPDQALNPAEHKYVKDAYFGGRVYVGKVESERGYEFDVNSMYPSRLAFKPVPTGDAEVNEYVEAIAAFDARLPGMYSITIDIPECHIPPLPVRTKTRIAYPWGRLTGTWALPEIERALEVGGKVVEVRRSINWPTSQILFKPWVEKLFALRIAAGKDTAMGLFLKFILNSLTGKFASRADKERLIINPDEIVACPCDESCERGEWCDFKTRALRGCAKGECKGACSRKCGSMRPIGNPRDALVYGIPVWTLDACAHIEWAAYLTAEARVEWHRQATSINEGCDVVYGDTDSLFVENERTERIGKELGQWGFNGEYFEMDVIAPKIYTLKENGKLKVRAKGITLPKDLERAAQMIEILPNGKSMPIPTSRKIVGTYAGAGKNEFFRVDHGTRQLSRGYGDRVLNSDGITTRPRNISEVDL